MHVGAVSDGSVGQREGGGRGIGRGHGLLEEREVVKTDTNHVQQQHKHIAMIIKRMN